MTASMRQLVAPAYLFLCLVLGGGAEGIWRNLILQLIALTIIAWAALERPIEPLPKPARQLGTLILLAVLLVILQLVPLPPAAWASLPGRNWLIGGYELLGQQPPWLPISLTPYDTLSMLPWLLPPLALLAAMVRLKAYHPSWMVFAMLAGMTAGVLLGALQVSTGPDGQWYLYRIANFGSATGFFANKNHMATLLLVSIPFLAALMARARGGAVKPHRYYAAVAVAGGVLVLILVGLVLNRSLAGWGLALPVLIVSGLIMTKGRGVAARIALGASAILAVAAIMVPFVESVMERVASRAEVSVETRSEIFATSAEAAATFAPLGSGVGSFVQVYRLFEDPALVTRNYVNHAHNDYLELLVETGLPGLLLMLLFLLWWAKVAVDQWRGAADAYARAASIASATILAHSLVDYPLRTAALAALFAVTLALMVQPRATAGTARKSNVRDVRHIEIA